MTEEKKFNELNLESVSRKIRAKIIDLAHKANCAHLASALSCVDILTALYWKILWVYPKNPKSPDRDRFILSKGHAAMALYSVLSIKGFLSEKELNSFGDQGTIFAEHPDLDIPGVETATGSLGHGLSVGLGMALAAKIQKQNYKVFVILSDGECNEGSTWEAAMFAPKHKLYNVCAVIDYNKWQATGRSNEILALEPLLEKWKSFGWDTVEVNGHDINALLKIFNNFPTSSGKPLAIIAHTIKGKGVSFMEDDNNWHYRVPDEKEVKKAKMELGIG